MGFGALAGAYLLGKGGGSSGGGPKNIVGSTKLQQNFNIEDYLRSLGLQDDYASQIMPSLERFYGQARGALANTAGLNRRQALSRENENLGGLAGQAVGSGLYGTSAYGNALRGVRSDTTRALAEGNLAASREIAGLYQDQGGAGASALGGLSSMYGNRAQQSFGNYQDILQYRQNQRHGSRASKGQLGSALGSIGGAALGSFFGPLGTAAGSALGTKLFGGGEQA
jgi:hypothetical protein